MDQDDEDLNFIRTETSPWEDVRKSWNNTFFSRMKFLNESSTENYFNSFPCLMHERGYELVSFLNIFFSKYFRASPSFSSICGLYLQSQSIQD